MALVEPIRINNLRELQKALKQADGESQKQLRVVFNQAADVVIGGARHRVPRGPSGAARASLKARSGQREAKAVGGGTKAPYYPWLDFGGQPGGAIGNRSRRRFVEGGRYLYPSWSANRKTILDALAESLTRVARDAGLQVT